jgi:hypothetical protein
VNLDCDLAAQREMTRAINLAHTARAEQGEDLIRTEGAADDR